MYFVITILFWGGAWVAAKMVVAEIHPYVAGSIRFVLAFFILFPFLIAQEGRGALLRWRDVPVLAFQGATGVFLYNVMFLRGMQTTSAINGSLIVAAGPVITALVSSVYLRERVGLRQLAGFAVSLAGVLVIVSQGSWQVLRQIHFNPGDVLIGIAVISWSLYSVGGKVAMQRISPLANTTYSCGLGAIMLSLLAWPYFNDAGLFSASGQAIGALIYLAVFASAIAFFTWFKGVQQIGASRAAVFLYLVPVTAALHAIPILDERVRGYHLIGALLVSSGVYVATHLQSRSRQVEPAGSALPVQHAEHTSYR
ncbi:hypothetical protein SY88_12570 [Clostridiales bacterium PH28_bin88]|nr:hypothetical protein SY88_12570 [Clostridiales bacterium PH28_bin88]